MVGINLLPDQETGGHTIFDPLTELLLERFNKVKETFDDTATGTFALPRVYINAEGQACSLLVAEGFQDSVIGHDVSLSRYVLSL